MTDEIILGSHMAQIRPLLEERKELAGDIAEFGCYAGATTVQLAQFNRFVWAFDTFEGIPYEDHTEGLDGDLPGKFSPPAGVWIRLAEYPNIRPIIGRFEETLPEMDPRTKIMLAYLDCDLYRSASQALDWLRFHLVDDGVIVLDDYATHRGIQRAVQEFLSDGWEFDGSLVIRKVP